MYYNENNQLYYYRNNKLVFDENSIQFFIFPKNQKTRPPNIQFFQRVNFATKKIGDIIHSYTLVFIKISRRIIQKVPVFTLEDFNTS